MKTEIRFLSQGDKAQIHDQTLSILAKTGVMVQTAKGRDILKQAGADVNDHTQIVLFPKTLIEQSIRQAPQQFKLGARQISKDFYLGQGHSTLCMTGEGTTVIDRQTGEYRDSIYQDLLDVTRLADAIDEIGIYWRTVTPSDMGNQTNPVSLLYMPRFLL